MGVATLACGLLCDSLSSRVAQNVLSCAPPPAMSHTVDHLPYIHPAAAATCARVAACSVSLHWYAFVFDR